MNWPRARVVLIAVFLTLDLLLGVVLLSGAGLPYRWRGPDARALTGQLARYGLRLEVPLPAAPTSLALRRLAQEPVPDGLLDRLFPDGVPAPERPPGTEDGASLYRGGGVAALVTHGGGVSVLHGQAAARRPVWPAPALGGGFGPLSADDPVAAALLRAGEAWLADWGWTEAADPRVAFDPETGRGTVSWRPQAARLPVYGSPWQAHFLYDFATGDVTLSGWERRWFRDAGPAGEPLPAVPPQTALLRLAGHLESAAAPGGAVVRLTLGYYSSEYQADAWDVPPVWRLDLADGRWFHVNALTGEMEAD